MFDNQNSWYFFFFLLIIFAIFYLNYAIGEATCNFFNWEGFTYYSSMVMSEVTISISWSIAIMLDILASYLIYLFMIKRK